MNVNVYSVNGMQDVWSFCSQPASQQHKASNTPQSQPASNKNFPKGDFHKGGTLKKILAQHLTPLPSPMHNIPPGQKLWDLV